MKTDLTDITFLILVRLDSIQRMENLVNITDSLLRYFNTNITVAEAAYYNNGFLQSLLNKKVKYQYIIDKDPVLYKTKHFNMMVHDVATKYVAIWDADAVVDKDAIIDAVNQLRSQKADAAYPYDGRSFDTSEILRTLFLKQNDIRLLYRHIKKMDLLHERLLVGGAVLIDKNMYILAGLENERYYGWGDDDFDRFYRFQRLGFKIYRGNTCLFHLSHPRSINSYFSSYIQSKISSNERWKTEHSSKLEILKEHTRTKK